MTLWEIKDTPEGEYDRMPTPSKFKSDWEDLDKNSYRSINSGNLIDTVVSQSWLKCYFEYNCLSREERRFILERLKKNPIYVRIEDDAISLDDKVELKMRCSRKSSEMLETGDYTLSFNLVQKIKVSGQ
jgi:hypothetical protein